ncbi:septum formation protein [Pseudoxanthomonas sp. GM95]|uniref:Maf family protein n=1 Tax=Pseudoxanthomonas sp. GM95 TaxID=1881043 RepID=UPI0008B23A1F|nr:Maf family nucleotide pyrophosphatase [Pseudoxanthomonas sp. GM95]SEK74234.1 septum formation protein [Pseudoxanthomonas sp. GM95]
MSLILASTSVYRRELLERLRLPFQAARPDVDETPLPGETPRALAERLAQAKAQAIARQLPESWVIGSDQAADLDGQPLGKPGQRDAAIAQLTAMSGRQVQFHTAVCVSHGERNLAALDTTTVTLRRLTHDEIARYVDAEQPFDCAGSFKCEGLGVTLFEAIETRDPTALIGLPLIATATLLRQAGFTLP